MRKLLRRRRLQVFVVETRTGSGITRHAIDMLPRVRTGIVEPVFQAEIDLAEDLCESEACLEAFEALVNDDSFMGRRFWALCGWNGDMGMEVPA